MKLKKSFICGFSLLSLACLASAQDAPKGPPPPGGPPPPAEGKPNGGPPGGGDPRARIMEFVKRADTNGDGKISKDEFAEMGKKENGQRFSMMDGNGDGFVDQDELGKVAQKMSQHGRPDGQGMRRPDGRPPGGEGGGFRRPPGNEGNARPGGERGSERPHGMFGDPKENFKRMDTDGNGSISEDEYIKASERMREMFRNRGRQPGQGNGFRRPEGGPPGGDGGFRRPPNDGGGPRPPEGDKPKDAA